MSTNHDPEAMGIDSPSQPEDSGAAAAEQPNENAQEPPASKQADVGEMDASMSEVDPGEKADDEMADAKSIDGQAQQQPVAPSADSTDRYKTAPSDSGLSEFEDDFTDVERELAQKKAEYQQLVDKQAAATLDQMNEGQLQSLLAVLNLENNEQLLEDINYIEMNKKYIEDEKNIEVGWSKDMCGSLDRFRKNAAEVRAQVSEDERKKLGHHTLAEIREKQFVKDELHNPRFGQFCQHPYNGKSIYDFIIKFGRLTVGAVILSINACLRQAWLQEYVCDMRPHFENGGSIILYVPMLEIQGPKHIWIDACIAAVDAMENATGKLYIVGVTDFSLNESMHPKKDFFVSLYFNASFTSSGNNNKAGRNVKRGGPSSWEDFEFQLFDPDDPEFDLILASYSDIFTDLFKRDCLFFRHEGFLRTWKSLPDFDFEAYEADQRAKLQEKEVKRIIRRAHHSGDIRRQREFAASTVYHGVQPLFRKATSIRVDPELPHIDETLKLATLQAIRDETKKGKESFPADTKSKMQAIRRQVIAEFESKNPGGFDRWKAEDALLRENRKKNEKLAKLRIHRFGRGEEQGLDEYATDGESDGGSLAGEDCDNPPQPRKFNRAKKEDLIPQLLNDLFFEAGIYVRIQPSAKSDQASIKILLPASSGKAIEHLVEEPPIKASSLATNNVYRIRPSRSSASPITFTLTSAQDGTGGEEDRHLRRYILGWVGASLAATPSTTQWRVMQQRVKQQLGPDLEEALEHKDYLSSVSKAMKLEYDLGFNRDTKVEKKPLALVSLNDNGRECTFSIAGGQRRRFQILGSKKHLIPRTGLMGIELVEPFHFHVDGEIGPLLSEVLTDSAAAGARQEFLEVLAERGLSSSS